MCKGVLNDHEVNNLHDKALRSCGIEIPEKKSEKMKMLVENIMTINDEIKKVGLSIRKGQDEDSGKSCFMLINLSNRLQLGNNRELAAGVQCQWSPQQLEYLRLLATEIILSEDKLVTSREALNLTDKVAKDKQNKKMTMEKAEETINKLMEARWIKVIQGNLTLDVRFLGEMESWMVEVVGAENIAYCKSCRKIVLRGRYCSCSNNIAWHNYCVAKTIDRGVDVKCMECREVVAKGRKGENGHSNGQARPSQRLDLPSQLERGEPSKRARRHESDDDEDDDDEMEVEVESPGRDRKRSGSRRSRSRDEDDEMEDESPRVRRSGGRIKRRMSGDSDSD